ncbi:MAG: NlpC/P60 family protein [Balneolaceae bacterium]
MHSPRLSIVLIMACLWASGCGLSARKTVTPSTDSQKDKVRVVEGESKNASLMQAYRDWKGVPYVLGGMSTDGVDCSSFISIVLDDYFGIDVPTNTRKQLNVGNGIRRTSLRTGDLVFFQTGRRTLHVGILVNEEEFLHASTSSGVMISDIREPYWADKYMAGRRVM